MNQTANGLWLVASKGEDIHAVRIDNYAEYRLPNWQANVDIDWQHQHNVGGNVDKLFIFNDRPVYRPGETAHFKGILRTFSDQGWNIPTGAVVNLSFYDARYQMFHQTNLAVSALGSLDYSLALPSASHGEYRLSAKLHTGNEESSLEENISFQVEEFRPNAFELTIQAPEYTAVGVPTHVPISAKYLLGQPLSKARIQWQAQSLSDPLSPDGFDGFQFASQVQYPNNTEASGWYIHGELDSHGNELAVEPEFCKNTNQFTPLNIQLQVQVTDLNQQTLSRSVVLKHHPSHFYLGVKKNNSIETIGTPHPIQVIAVSTNGTPNAEPVQAHIVIQQIRWNPVRIQGAGNTIAYKNELSLIPQFETNTTTLPLQHQDKQWIVATNTDSSPIQTPVFIPTEPGQYLVEVTTSDSENNPVKTAYTFSVTGAKAIAWDYKNEVQIQLEADRDLYKAGDTAAILVKTPIQGNAWVTIERGTVLRSFVTNLTGNTPVIQVPILSSDAPNVFVSVLQLRGADNNPRQNKLPEHRFGTCLLKVEHSDAKLDVVIQHSSDSYLPGQTVPITVTVSNKGQPVTGAEVTLYAVDEGVLQLGSYNTPDPFQFFYSNLPLEVQTDISLKHILAEDPELRHYPNKGFIIGDGGKESKSVRQNFLACVYWGPALITDASGKTTCSFPAPDNLTRYRVFAVAHHQGGRFGSGDNRFKVNKPLMTDPALPRFVNVGDRLLARAMVHNLTSESRSVEISLQLDQYASPWSPTNNGPDSFAVLLKDIRQVQGPSNSLFLIKTIPIQAGASTVVDFPIQLVKPGSARWIWAVHFVETPDSSSLKTNLAKASEFTDAVVSELKVGHLSPLMHDVFLSRQNQSSSNLLEKATPGLLEADGLIRIRLANSRMLEIEEAVSQLLHYPYGCVEQTTSALLPWLVLKDFPFMPRFKNEKGREMSASESAAHATRKGIDHILSMQTMNGGLSYWPGGREPLPWGSAYGGLALVMAKTAGHPVPQGAFDSLIKYLAEYVRSTEIKDHNADVLCLSLYVLALANHAETSIQDRFYDVRHSLSPENRALLALAMSKSGSKSEMIEDLLRPTPEELKPAAFDFGYFGCPDRQTAVRLLAWLQVNDANAALENLVEELIRSRTEGHWGTTQGNAWAMLALAQYARHFETESAQFSGQLLWGGHKKTFELSESNRLIEVEWPLDPSLAHEPLQLLFTHDTNQMASNHATLCSQVVVDSRSSKLQPPRRNQGIDLHRKYALLRDDGSIGDLAEAKVGERVLVELILEARETTRFIAVDDPWPATLEGLSLTIPDKRRTNEPGIQEWYGDFKEFANDRALFFRDYLPQGKYRIEYLTRVRAAGSASAPCAKASAMYMPAKVGTTETTPITSKRWD